MHISLSAYSAPDFETLYAIDQACYPRGIAYSRSTLREFLNSPGAECLVAQTRDDGPSSIAGFIIAESAGAHARIITIDVLEKHRRAGVGSALLRAIEQRLATAGV